MTPNELQQILRQSRESGSRLDLSDADLRGADLRDADLRDADLRGADLRGALLRGAYLCGADLRDADLRGADLRGALLRDALLRDANLRGADLRDADLRGADLCGADLRDADLRGANLRGANLCGADLSGALGLNIAEDAPARLQAVARAALASPDSLAMDQWHTCKTTHCICGWAEHLGGPLAKLIIEQFGNNVGGLMLLGVEAHAHFYDTDENARVFLQSVIDQANVSQEAS